MLDASSACPPPGANLDQIIEAALARHAGEPGNLLPILHAIQDAIGHVPAAAVPRLAEALQRSRAEIHGVLHFYSHLRERPAGDTVVEICRAEACQAMGAERLAEHARQRLGCDFHHTTADGRATLEPVYCLGLCAQSPAIAINGPPHVRVSPARLDHLLAEQGVGA